MPANTILITPILDSDVNTIIRINILGGGTSEVTDYPIYNPADYVNEGVSKRLMCAKYCFDGFSGKLDWGSSSANKPLITLEKDHYSEFKFDGGLPNNMVADRDGTILLTTKGLLLNATGSIFLFVKSQDAMPGVP